MDCYPTPPARTGRALHLLDVENLLGGRWATGQVADLWRAYARAVGVGPKDGVFAAFGPTGAARSVFELPSRVTTRIGAIGADSADLALLSLVQDSAWVAARYTRVIVASADHIFAPAATALAGHGIHLTQVLGQGTPAAVLTLACHTTIRLPRPTGAAPTAA